jgi:hypothetical protein
MFLVEQRHESAFFNTLLGILDRCTLGHASL